MGQRFDEEERRKVFIGGPIQFAISDHGFDGSLRLLIDSVIDVFERSGFDVLSAHREEQFGACSDQFAPEFVTRRDYAWMQACHLYVAILPVRNSVAYRSDGTHIEIGWAGALRRPVIVVGNSPLSEEYSHLLRGLGQLTQFCAACETSIRQDPTLLVQMANQLIQELHTA